MGSYGTIFQHISTNKKIQKGYEVAWKKRTEAATLAPEDSASSEDRQIC